MGIDANPKPTTSPEDQETLRRVYQDELRSLEPQFASARDRLGRANGQLHQARLDHTQAVSDLAKLEGQVDAVRALAARDGITDL